MSTGRLGRGGESLPGPEQQLISRTWRAVAVQTAAVFAMAMAASGALAAVLILHTQHDAEQARLREAIEHPNTAIQQPGLWVYEATDDGLTASPGAPVNPPDPIGLERVEGGDETRTIQVHIYDHEYLVRTERRDGRIVQAALNLSGEEDEQHRLFLGLTAAGGLGLALAAGVGALVARRAIKPLGLAMGRQRRFIADASHELRTPLTQLHTRAQLLQRELRGGGDRDRVAADAEQLVRGTRQMGEMVEELLLVASLRAQPQRSGPVDLDELAAQASAAEQPRAAERGVDIEVVAEPGEHVVSGITPALRRVLTSLLDNALAHTEPGGHIWLQLSRDSAARTVVCTVRDDGEGFDPADAQRLFERFARGRHGDGRRFGLGLALVREVVDAHGGTVTAVGSPGQGAAFTVRLPAWSPREAPATNPPAV